MKRELKIEICIGEKLQKVDLMKREKMIIFDND
jgi:hypothetical protein